MSISQYKTVADASLSNRNPCLRLYLEATRRMASSIPAAQLRAKLQNSEVLTPDSAGFEDSLKRWNAGIEKRAV